MAWVLCVQCSARIGFQTLYGDTGIVKPSTDSAWPAALIGAAGLPDGNDTFSAHGLPDETVAALKALLTGKARQHIGEAYVARRSIPADPGTVQWVMGVKS
jgi:hypothetical protein